MLVSLESYSYGGKQVFWRSLFFAIIVWGISLKLCVQKITQSLSLYRRSGTQNTIKDLSGTPCQEKVCILTSWLWCFPANMSLRVDSKKNHGPFYGLRSVHSERKHRGMKMHTCIWTASTFLYIKYMFKRFKMMGNLIVKGRGRGGLFILWLVRRFKYETLRSLST